MKITLVAGEILGAHKNGGIGTATSHLAAFLARNGHSVRIVYTGGSPLLSTHPWIRRLESDGVRLVHLDRDRSPIYPRYLREGSEAFEYLRYDNDDLIIFQDWEGSAFYSVSAKKAGLAFANTRLAVIAHGSTEWLLDANRTRANGQVTLAHIHMERAAYEGADAVICPSRHMYDWLGDIGYAISDKTALPLYLWSDPHSDLTMRRLAPLREVRTLAYFGRMEERKGIELFLKAILDERLSDLSFNVIFVGKEATLTRPQVLEMVGKLRPQLLPRLRFETDLDSDEAQQLLVTDNCLAIIPSLIDNAPCVISECIRRKSPFLAAATGGIPELVSPDDHARALFAPNAKALADRLVAVIGKPFAEVRPSRSESEVATAWKDWLAAQEAKHHAAPQPPASVAASPADLAVIVTHYERPQLLNQTLAGLAMQTATDFDLVLVDDGSRSEAARQNLDEIERRSWPFRLRVLRQPNRYLGAARNAGIKATDAARLIFMDDDNIAFPDMIETFASAQRRSGADIVTCQMSIFREATGEPDLALLGSGERWAFTGGPVELGLSVNCFGDATGIYRREVFDRVGFFHEWHGTAHEDWHLHARAALAGLKHLSLPIPLYWYRRVESGMLSTTDVYLNNRIIWDVYKAAVPASLSRLIDLSVRHEAV
jgi:glycosyltransferase involved in cell wall biosynthesis/GT2 family glycosyltransferase